MMARYFCSAIGLVFVAISAVTVVSHLVQRQFARFPAMVLAGGILFVTVAFRPFGPTLYEPIAILIGLGAAMLVLLAEAMKHDGADLRRIAPVLGGASGVLLAPACFLFGVSSWYSGPSRRLYVACYVMLTLGAAFPAVRHGAGRLYPFWLAMLGSFGLTFAILCLRWLFDRWSS